MVGMVGMVGKTFLIRPPSTPFQKPLRLSILAAPPMRTELQPTNHRVSGLVDVLDRVLDKGLAIAGDIKISLAEVELLTIRIRLIICSIDKAQEIGLDWWKHDRHLAPGRHGAVDGDDLRAQ